MAIFSNESKLIFRRAARVIKKILSSEDSGYFEPNDPESVDNDAVAKAMAKRDFELIYPPGRSLDDLNNVIINKKSFLNFLLAGISSAAMLVFLCSFAMVFVMIAAYCWDILWGLHVWSALEGLPGVGLTTFVGGTMFAVSLGARLLDRRITAEKCIESAKRELRDPELQHEEKCFLMLERVNRKAEETLAAPKAEIKDLKKKIAEIALMCIKVGETSISDEEESEELKPWRERIDGFRARLIWLKDRVRDYENKLDSIRANIMKSQAMSAAIGMSGDIAELDSGELDNRFKEITEATSSEIDALKFDAELLHEGLLTQAGIPLPEAKKPKLLP